MIKFCQESAIPTKTYLHWRRKVGVTSRPEVNEMKKIALLTAVVSVLSLVLAGCS